MEPIVVFGLIAGLGITCIILGIKIKVLEDQITKLYSWRKMINDVCLQLTEQDKRAFELFNQIDALNQLTVKRLNLMQDYIYVDYNNKDQARTAE